MSGITHEPTSVGPLQGVRVLDLSTSYAGPSATMYLADLGAEVVKVERPGRGDDARAWGPPFAGSTSAWFASANRNKESIVIDLRSPGGQAVLDRLLGEVDVLVQNFNPGKLESLGLSPEALRKRFPGLIQCAISGFGLDGPDATLPGYDLVAQARSGLMSVTGERGSPTRVSTALSDIVTGISACVAICAALRRQALTGDGDVIDMALLDSDLTLMAPRIASYLAGEPEPQPCGGADSVLAVYQAMPTADDPIVLAVGNDVIWQRCVTEMGLEHLASDPRLQSNAGRRSHRDEIVDAIRERLATRPANYWLERFAAVGVPAAPIQRLSQVVADPQVNARGSVISLAPDDAGVQAQVVRSAWRLASQPMYPNRAAPELGSSTVEVLRRYGFTDDDIAHHVSAGDVEDAGTDARVTS
jgi:crotonobetainyl-CoA:carnitine CoA-transferase CaiB-like acyl-CoA transferase